MTQRERKRGSDEPPQSGWYRRVLKKLAGPWGVLVGIATVVGTALAVHAAVTSPASSAQLTAEEQRLIELIPAKLGRHCRPYVPGFDSRYLPLVSADVKCEPLDPGPDALKFHLFTTPRDLEDFMALQLEDMAEAGVSCASGDFSYASPWADEEGKVIGELFCGDYDGLSRLLWSYEDLLIVASAGAPPKGGGRLHEWWQRHVRFDGADPPEHLREHLLSLLPTSFGQCEPISVLLPMSLAGVICRPGEGITSAGAQLFPNAKLLTEYIEQQANQRGIDDDNCKNTPFSYMSYGWAPDYRPTLGYLLCRPQFGAEWFEWTANRPRVYAFAARRDNDFVRLYEQWAQSLSWIKHLQPGQ